MCFFFSLFYSLFSAFPQSADGFLPFQFSRGCQIILRAPR